MKSDYEKIGVKVLSCHTEHGRWVFDHNGRTFQLAPSPAVRMVLSPVVVGVDRLILLGCEMKNIPSPEAGVLVLYSEEFFPGADVKFTYAEPRFEGWLYDVEELNLTGLLPRQQAWVCTYMTMLYTEPPKTLYLKIEAKDG